MQEKSSRYSKTYISLIDRNLMFFIVVVFLNVRSKLVVNFLHSLNDS